MGSSSLNLLTPRSNGVQEPPVALFRPEEPRAATQRPRRAAPKGWMAALEEQKELCLWELEQPDCDDAFWRQELVAVESALGSLEGSIGAIDAMIASYEATRATIVRQLGERMKQRMPGTNLPDFLMLDDPEGYVRW